MSIRTTFARSINAVLGKVGYRIVRASPAPDSIEAAFSRFSVRPVPINTVIDVGASDGRWSEIIHPFYPDAFYFLVEANPYHEPGLKRYQQQNSLVEYVLAAAGNSEGEIFFDSKDPFSGVASPISREGYIRVPVTTIDAQVRKHELKPPFLLKLDTHGFELPILNGAADTLQQTDLLVIETYNFQIQPDSLRFHEMCNFMESKGFRPIDIIEPLHRQKDEALWQFDLVFIRANRPEFQINTYT